MERQISFREALQTSSPKIRAIWDTVLDEMEAAQHAWIVALRAQGVMAAHPDDGWVNRETSEVTFVYPQFNDGIEIGDLVALGHPDTTRIVRIVGHRHNRLGMDYWQFKEENNAESL